MLAVQCKTALEALGRENVADARLAGCCSGVIRVIRLLRFRSIPALAFRRARPGPGLLSVLARRARRPVDVGAPRTAAAAQSWGWYGCNHLRSRRDAQRGSRARRP